MKNSLGPEDIKKLRESFLISDNETAMVVGDLVVAENVITKERRVLDTGNLLFESAKRVLKG